MRKGPTRRGGALLASHVGTHAPLGLGAAVGTPQWHHVGVLTAGDDTQDMSAPTIEGRALFRFIGLDIVGPANTGPEP